MHHERLTCRLCGGGLRGVLSLPATPPANAFLKAKLVQEHFPLNVMLCNSCGHSQLQHVVDPKILFENYCYVSGTSPSFVQHFKLYAGEIDSKFPRRLGDRMPFVVEVGSNDGTLLKALENLGWRVVGVEPAVEIAQQARENGVPTITGFFNSGVTNDILVQHGVADVVVANNVLAHVDDLVGVIEGVKALLHGGGLFVFEVQYIGDLLKHGLFDNCYHEHLDYHAVKPLVAFLNLHGLEMVDVLHVPTHGGSIRCWAQWQGGPRSVTHDRINALIGNERMTGALNGTGWEALVNKIKTQRSELRLLLNTFKQRACNIVAYGAPAKLTTFMYGLGLTADDFDYVVDESDLKIGKYTPGIHIPVVHPKVLYEGSRGYPDLIVVTAWNFAPQILEKLKPLMESGTHVAVPLPVLKVYP